MGFINNIVVAKYCNQARQPNVPGDLPITCVLKHGFMRFPSDFRTTLLSLLGYLLTPEPTLALLFC
jgi:hypothetical protein